jgi:hypothetical protein
MVLAIALALAVYLGFALMLVVVGILLAALGWWQMFLH